MLQAVFQFGPALRQWRAEQLRRYRCDPAALVVQRNDSLLISGVVLSNVWFDRKIPVVEYPDDDLYDRIADGAQVEVDGDAGEIRVLSPRNRNP